MCVGCGETVSEAPLSLSVSTMLMQRSYFVDARGRAPGPKVALSAIAAGRRRGARPTGLLALRAVVLYRAKPNGVRREDGAARVLPDMPRLPSLCHPIAARYSASFVSRLLHALPRLPRHSYLQGSSSHQLSACVPRTAPRVCRGAACERPTLGPHVGTLGYIFCKYSQCHTYTGHRGVFSSYFIRRVCLRQTSIGCKSEGNHA